MFKYIYKKVPNSNTCVLRQDSKLLFVLSSSNTIIRHSVNINKNDVFFDPQTNTISVKNNTIDLVQQSNLYKYNSYIVNLNKTFFQKIKFTGKGFRLSSYKNKRLIEFVFGYSHIYLLYIQTVKYKRLSKYKYIFFSKNYQILSKLIRNVINVRKINVYTLRGLRQTKSIIIKRKGRKSPNL